MEPILFGLAAPSIASAAGAVGHAVSAVAKPLATPFALLLQAKSQPAATAEPQTVGLEDIGTRADALQEDLERRIFQAIEDSGIRLDSPVRLSISEFDGRLEADLASPQREVLEAALANNPDLADDFRELAAYKLQANDHFEAVLHFSAPEGKARLEFE